MRWTQGESPGLEGQASQAGSCPRWGAPSTGDRGSGGLLPLSLAHLLAHPEAGPAFLVRGFGVQDLAKWLKLASAFSLFSCRPLYLPRSHPSGHWRKGLLGCPHPLLLDFPKSANSSPPWRENTCNAGTLARCAMLPSSLRNIVQRRKNSSLLLDAVFTSSSTDPSTSGGFIYNSFYNSFCLEALVALLTDWCLQNIAVSLTIPKCAVVVFADLCFRKI